jgi:putative transposase
MALFRGKYRIESARLPNYDYTSSGRYFITICTHDRQHFFGEVRSRVMHFSPMGAIAHKLWVEIPNHHPYVRLDTHIIMPNHIHGILVIDRPHPPAAACTDVRSNVCTGSSGKGRNFGEEDFYQSMGAISPRAHSLSLIVRNYKGAVTHWCRQNGYSEFRWLARFHDHVIRNDEALDRIRRYIINNPAKWRSSLPTGTNIWMK